jgi:hypothetical protein
LALIAPSPLVYNAQRHLYLITAWASDQYI